MFNKLKTVWRVWSTFGLLEVYKLLLRKSQACFGSGSGVNFPSGIKWVDFLSSNFLTQSEVEHETSSHNSSVAAGTQSQEGVRSGFFDSAYDLGPELSHFLVWYCKSRKPTLVLETGVAAGKSSSLILTELNTNRHGSLVSFDITSKVGELIPTGYRNQWSLIVLPSFGKKRAFSRSLDKYNGAELFLHDSDHSVMWQKYEILAALEKLTALEYLLVDDITPELVVELLARIPMESLTFLNEDDKKKSLIIKVK